QAEIRYVGLARFIEKDIARLEIAMQKTALMGMMHGPRRRLHQESDAGLLIAKFATRPRLANGIFAGARIDFWQAPFRDMLRQASAFDEFHGEVRKTVVLAAFINGYNVRMIQIGDQLGFQTKALPIR